MKLSAVLLFSSIVIALLPSVNLAAEPNAKGVAFFEKRIRPVLVQHCYECHSAESDEPKGGLLLDTRENIRRGGDSGHAVVPQDLAESLIIEALEHESFAMPPDQRLDDAIVADRDNRDHRGRRPSR